VWQALLGEPFIGAQDDIWSQRSCRESFGALRVSFIMSDGTKLIDVNPLLAFRVFTSSSHTGAVIATWKKQQLAEWGLDAVKSVRLWTEDGASNNLKSSKILGAPSWTCGPHHFQRANMHALGMGGSKQSSNLPAKSFIKRLSRQSSSFHSSGIANKALQESQRARGVPRNRIKTTECANATRWTGIFRCAQKSRVLEEDIKVSLTGDKDGLCGEEPADIQVVEDSSDEGSGDEAAREQEAQPDGGSDAESDAEQVAANEASGKKFPLAQRCLEGKEWKQTNQLESVLLTSHESVMLMQKGTGVDPGTVFLLAQGCHNVNKSAKLNLVSGAGEKEVWKDVHEASLDPMFRTYRRIMAEQLDQRFKLSGHPGREVLLCLKLNPLVDTSATSLLFQGKSSVRELMDGEYLRCLRLRSMAMAGPSADPAPSPAPADGNAPSPATGAAATGAAATNAAAAASATKKRKVSVLGALQGYSLTAAPNPTAVEDSIMAEIAKFDSIKVALAASGQEKYTSSGIFDPISFWNDHDKVLPIHAKVFRADTGPMKGASANVESIFSGVKRLLGDFAATMSPEILELYVFIHYNWDYEFMRPTTQEIVDAYLHVNGAELPVEDIDADLESEPDEEGEEEGEEGGD
jgi:hypothetical protein